MYKNRKIVVVIPCYNCKEKILEVLSGLAASVDHIIVVDDACPSGTGRYVQTHCRDPRVEVLFHSINGGVGAAMRTGYRRSLELRADITVKMDGDGQMDPALLESIINPIRREVADYVKGNRFFEPEMLRQMPWFRLLGNSALSFLAKLATGYWNIMDPTNGYTAIHHHALSLLKLEKIDPGFFFETDMLFRLNLLSAAVVDVPMHAIYDDERSNLRIFKALPEFAVKNIRCFTKRILYTYFIRDFNIATLQFVGAVLLIGFGCVFGSYHWYLSATLNVPATSGTVMLSALPMILGIQFILSALAYDISNIPRIPLQKILATRRPGRAQIEEEDVTVV